MVVVSGFVVVGFVEREALTRLRRWPGAGFKCLFTTTQVQDAGVRGDCQHRGTARQFQFAFGAVDFARWKPLFRFENGGFLVLGLHESFSVVVEFVQSLWKSAC